MTLRGRLGPLVGRDFRLPFTATTVTTIGDRLALIALTFAVLDVGSTTDLGIVLGSRQAVEAVVLVFGGVISDRLPRNLVLVGASLVQGAAQAVTAALVLGGGASVGALVALQAAYGIGSGMVVPAEVGLVPQTVSAERLQQANALQGLSRNIVGVIGPAVGGAIVVAGSPGSALAVDAVSFAVCSLLLARIRVVLRREGPPRGSYFRELRDGWTAFTSQTWLWTTVGIFGISNMFFVGCWAVLGPTIAKEELGGAGAWAVILSAGGAGAVRPSHPSTGPEHGPDYDAGLMTVRVRMAPSPTGFLHIGGVRTFLFNWLFARGRGGECRLRIENTDTSREVAESVEQIQRSLIWLGIDWDGELTFQLDRMDTCRDLARKLVDEGKAYEDEGAIRIRMPDEGATAWDDLIRGRIEYPNEKLEDLVAVRADGRPTYNFASPVEDWLDGITDVIRGEDHISNTPKQIHILEALGVPLPEYGHVGHILGPDGKSLSKRHGAVTVDEFRAAGYLPDALVNYLARLGWSYDDKTEVFSREALIRYFTLERVSPSSAVFDYEKLRWLNGLYLRAMSVEEYAETLLAYLRERGLDWPEELVRRAVPLVKEKIATLGEFPRFAGFLLERVEPDPALLDGSAPLLAEARGALAEVEPFTAAEIEKSLRELAGRVELSPRKAFQPIRIAVTGSTVSPGLFESLELLGKEETLARPEQAG